MKRCLSLARKGAGHVSPNPLVGCVIVGPDNTVIGEGFHAVFGGPHAEVNAINNCFQNNKNQYLERSILYVNLEPCTHYGKTPPCTDLLLEAGVPQVVIGTEDPNPVVAGKGIVRLRKAGVVVRVGIEENASRRLNEAFIHQLSTGRPLVTVKVAQTLDGAIATLSGKSQWISDLASRRKVHQWRSEFDAVLVGSGTARNDNPSLTVRLARGRNPLRIIVDRSGSLPEDLNLFSDDHVDRTLVVHDSAITPSYATEVMHRGGRLLGVPQESGHSFLDSMLHQLGQSPYHIQSILVEAGPGLVTTLLREDLVDRFYAFIAPKIFGSGLSVLNDLGIREVDRAIEFVDAKWTRSGKDILFRGFLREV